MTTMTVAAATMTTMTVAVPLPVVALCAAMMTTMTVAVPLPPVTRIASCRRVVSRPAQVAWRRGPRRRGPSVAPGCSRV
jgi:hypothetical protein